MIQKLPPFDFEPCSLQLMMSQGNFTFFSQTL